MPADSTAEGDKPREPDAQEKALVQRWLKRIKKKRDSKTFRAHMKAVREGRAMVYGKSDTTDENGTVSGEQGPKANLLLSKIQGAEQRVYAKNPQIVVTPEEQVEPIDKPDADDGAMLDPMAQQAHEAEEDMADAEKQMMTQFCRTAEVLLGRAFVKEGRLKDRAKAAVRRAFTSRIAWAKVTYSRDKKRDPLILNQLKDSQDNMLRLEAQLKRLRSPERVADAEAEIAATQQMIASLQEQAEVTINEGLVIDILDPTAVCVLKENRQDFADYIQAPAIVHSELYTAEEMETAFGLCAKEMESLTKFRRDGGAAQTGDDDPLYMVHECWSQADQTVYTLTDGLDRWLRDPWVPKSQGERWYPFFALGFYLVDGHEYPLSAPELLGQLQADYERTRQMQEEHRAESMPSYFVAGGQLEETDIQAIANRKANGITPIKGWNPGTPFDQVVARFAAAQMDPKVYDTGPIRNDMEMVFGVSDAASGAVVDAKTATEAEIVQAQFGERVSAFVDTVEDWISEMAHYSLEVLLLELNEDQVRQICGQAAVWPQMSRQDIYERVRAQVLAGTTSKPNKRMERETWMMFLPQLMSMMQAYAALMAQGQAVAAGAVKEVAKETARRFDERINIDRFFPDVPPPSAMPGMPAGAAAGLPPELSDPAMQPGADLSGAPGMLTAAAAQSADMLPSPAQVQ
jgi:hypothetical protein